MLEHPMTLGSQVGPYRILGALGSGGMGLVYRAVHAQLDRPTAIKVLRPELAHSVGALDRFLNEARAASAFRHPGVIEIYDYGVTPSGRPFIAMELLDGMTLGRCLAHDRPPLVGAARIARQIAGALAAAHEAGIVHRDLKPDNVFLVRDRRTGAHDRAKLLDFGIARRGGQVQQHADIVLGTPAYMAPEQCRDDSDCDHRADLYALGCVLFEMLSGQPPFGHGPAEMLSAAHLVAPIPDLGAGGDVAPELAQLAARLLAKRPDERPCSAVEVVALLDRWLAGAAPRAPQGERAESRNAPGAGDGPRLANGTSRRTCMDTAPTEPMPRAIHAVDAVDAGVRARRTPDAQARLALGA